LQEASAQQKASFDKRHHVTTPSWKVGDLVYSEKLNPPPASNKVLTHQKFVGPYFIIKLVQRQATTPTSDEHFPLLSQTEIPTAYELTHAQTGKILKSLVPSRRLKRCYDKTLLNQRWPPLAPDQTVITSDNSRATSDKPLSASKTEAQTKMAVNPSVKPAPHDNRLPPEWEMAKAIVRKRVRSGVTEFLVKFQDNSAYWCLDVSDELKRRFFLKLANERNKRRRAARQNFKD
jgi:hypothetical protein